MIERSECTAYFYKINFSLYIFKDGEHYSSNNDKEVNEGRRQTSINSNIHNPIITKIQKIS